MSLAKQARPIIDIWASHWGVAIEFLHEWEKDDTRRVTAFGYDESGAPRTHTVVVPAEYPS
jgi:hypothetical protein